MRTTGYLRNQKCYISSSAAELSVSAVFGIEQIYLQVPDQASSILAKDARPHLLKLGDLAQSPHQHGHSQFQTCSHCSGSVQNI